MPKCQVTGKKTTRGNKYSIRGIAKKQKGIGLNITGKTRRTFKPNIIEKKLWFPEEKRFITLKLSTSALRTIDKVGVGPIVRKLRAQGHKI
ncbi:50S ribosomal protein L28 [Waddlia chondrophila 2032/99]|uniref:Large ribosomal subunit protein bL28 n=2 Tax=Waddlia chondrophila TaxID=71667 RepID=D6YVB6_WADCW|nr:50S ribosomal protein L28 [Waddlia chondrophila]ADI38077.1 50S ribosomal protein L28 [Waddlia chondrophila WSU 86-1044]CCB91223.1 50S ribosomal protein L28 [Waddlia chondrophila 2032/99]